MFGHGRIFSFRTIILCRIWWYIINKHTHIYIIYNMIRPYIIIISVISPDVTESVTIYYLVVVSLLLIYFRIELKDKIHRKPVFFLN